MRPRCLLVLACVALVGCGRGRRADVPQTTTVPPALLTQLHDERGCDASGGVLTSSTPTQQVWRVDGCGAPIVLTCPVVRGSLGRCRDEVGRDEVGGVAGATGATPEPRPAPTAEPTPTGQPTGAYDDDPEADLRRAIDARARAVLECTRGALTAVDVSWTIDGEVDVTLTGGHAGTPAEACASRALEGLPIPEGEAGRLRHPIRAP